MLATSGTTGAVVDAFCTQWGDAALAARDAKARKSDAVVAAVDNFDCLESPRPPLALKMRCRGMTRIHRSMSMKVITRNPMKKMLNGTLVILTMIWMIPHTRLVLRLNSLMAILKTLRLLHHKCTHQQVVVFQRHVNFCPLLRVPEATFLFLVLVLLTAWLIRPLIGTCKVSLQRHEKQKGIRFAKKWKVAKPRYTWNFAETTDIHVQSLVFPLSKKRPTETGVSRGGPHQAPRLCPDQCMVCLQMGHRASECSDKGKATAFSLGTRAFGTYVLGCAVFDVPCYGATVRNRTRSRLAILHGEATKTVSGFMSVQPIADQYEDTTIETTYVGFTFNGGETEAASTKICIPHAEFPRGISVNVVTNESTPLLIGLDVLREYGMVIDYHNNRVYSHVL